MQKHNVKPVIPIFRPLIDVCINLNGLQHFKMFSFQINRLSKWTLVPKVIVRDGLSVGLDRHIQNYKYFMEDFKNV